MKRFVSKTIMLIILCFLLIFPSMAFTDIYFIDVNNNHPYINAVNYLVKNEYTSGVGNNKFEPNRQITVDEYTVLIMNAFCNDYFGCLIAEGKNWADNYVNTAICFGVYSSEDYYNAKENGLTWEFVIKSLLGFTDFSPYPSWIYSTDEVCNDYIRDAVKSLVASEVFPQGLNLNNTPTRAEVAQLIYSIKLKLYMAPEDFNYSPIIDIIWDADERANICLLRNDALYELTFIPDKYIKSFNNLGWQLRLSNSMFKYGYDPLSSGITAINEETITLASAFYPYEKYVLVHEFGHFVDVITNYSSASLYMYQFELDNIEKITGSSYCRTNEMECFAEAFSYVLVNRNNPEAYSKMQELIPMTLEYIEKGYLDANGLIDLEAIAYITNKYTS